MDWSIFLDVEVLSYVVAFVIGAFTGMTLMFIKCLSELSKAGRRYRR